MWWADKLRTFDQDFLWVIMQEEKAFASIETRSLSILIIFLQAWWNYNGEVITCRGKPKNRVWNLTGQWRVWQRIFGREFEWWQAGRVAEVSTTVLCSDIETGNIGSIGFQRKARYMPLHTGRLLRPEIIQFETLNIIIVEVLAMTYQMRDEDAYQQICLFSTQNPPDSYDEWSRSLKMWVYRKFGCLVPRNTRKYSYLCLARVNSMHNVGRSIDWTICEDTLSAFYVTPTWIEQLHWAIWLVVLRAGNREVTTNVQGERQADAMWLCKLWVLNSAKTPSYRTHCTQISLRILFLSVHPNAGFSPSNVAPPLNSQASAWSKISLISVMFSSALLATTHAVYSSIDVTAPPLLIILLSTRSAL